MFFGVTEIKIKRVLSSQKIDLLMILLVQCPVKEEVTQTCHGIEFIFLCCSMDGHFVYFSPY